MLLEGLNGVLCLIDAFLCEAKHDHRLQTVLRRIVFRGYSQFQQVSFLPTRIIDKNGVSADPDKTAAMTRMPPPMKELTYPLRQLL